MTELPTSTSLGREDEKAEVKAVLVTLGRSPLMARLFGYICDKYFAGQAGELSEVKIATEVFGRGPNFDRSQDAIARVEAHRLRKRLREYYASEGKSHLLQIELPAGSYAPVFRHMAPMGETALVEHVPEPPQPKPQPPPEQPALPPEPPSRRWPVRLSVAGLALIAALAVFFTTRSKPRPAPAATAPPAEHASSLPATPPLTGTVRLLCGYQGASHIDDLGRAWGPDRFFTGGRPWPTRPGFIRRTNDPFLFRNQRTGEFSYDIPVPPGFYELHLYFVESEYGEDLGGGENSRTMRIWLNGRELFQTFDPISDAGGPRIADERVFKDVQPASDGKIHIGFESQRGQPMLSALELLPGLAHRTLPIRLVTQTTSYTDHSGQLWAPDNYYLGGQIFGGKPAVSNAPDPGLFSTERAGNFSYALPVDTRSTYTAQLYFAETYFGKEASGVGGVGSRIFDLMCNGVLLLDHFDVYKEAGGAGKALVKTFRGLKPNARGKLDFKFDPIANYASVFAIQIEDESR